MCHPVTCFWSPRHRAAKSLLPSIGETSGTATISAPSRPLPRLQTNRSCLKRTTLVAALQDPGGQQYRAKRQNGRQAVADHGVWHADDTERAAVCRVVDDLT